MERDIEDMGEEEIRARMELKKLLITALIGFIFTLFVASTIVGTEFMKDEIDVLDFTGAAIVIFSSIWVFARTILKPKIAEYVYLARELDRRKKLE